VERSFWEERWREGRIGFHEGAPNKYLSRHAPRLAGRVLVPLCGKAKDLAFLASRGHDVVGIELVEDAVRAFFTEHGVTPVITPRDELVEYRAGSITIFAGDVFATTRELVGEIDAVYDRAALIALPAELRPRYVDHLRALVAPGTPGLLITLEYEQAQMTGPPFSVVDAEVRAHFGDAVVLLDEGPAKTPRLRELGVTATERCFSVTF
jgi:thiopurine S-methyltransferase